MAYTPEIGSDQDYPCLERGPKSKTIPTPSLPLLFFLLTAKREILVDDVDNSSAGDL